MGAIFSKRRGRKPKKVEVTDHDRAVLELKTAKDRLKKYQTRMRNESGKLQDQARALVAAQKKDRALLLLKLRRYKEQEGSKAEAQLLNVEQMIVQIEWEKEQVKVFEALKAGNKVLEDIHKVMTIEEVEKLMADTQDAMEYEHEISRLLQGSLSTVEEEAVLKEFEALEAEEEEEKQGQAVPGEKAETPAAAQELPEAPSHAPQKAETPTAVDLPEAPTHKPEILQPHIQAEERGGEKVKAKQEKTAVAL